MFSSRGWTQPRHRIRECKGVVIHVQIQVGEPNLNIRLRGRCCDSCSASWGEPNLYIGIENVGEVLWFIYSSSGMKPISKVEKATCLPCIQDIKLFVPCKSEIKTFLSCLLAHINSDCLHWGHHAYLSDTRHFILHVTCTTGHLHFRLQTRHLNYVKVVGSQELCLPCRQDIWTPPKSLASPCMGWTATAL